MSDKKTVVIGHKNPDTDSVVSAFVWSRLLSRKGRNASPAVAGPVNKETELVFEKAGLEVPKQIDLEGKDLFLVDHNSENQMLGDPQDVIGVLDHHKLSGLTTGEAIFFRNEPLGSTSSLIRKIVFQEDLELKEEEAFLLLGGIISDTLKFNSPTTTQKDINFGNDLADRLEVDIDSVAEEMFDARSDFSDMSLDEVIVADYKNYQLGDKVVGVGVAEVASTKYFKSKREEILEAVRTVKKKRDLDYLFFGVIDILKQNTSVYSPSQSEKQLAEKAFNINYNSNPVLLEGVASRKKQIIPPLSEVLK